MAGLLDAFGDDNTRFSLGLLAAAGPRFDGANDGQRIQEALMGMDAYKQNKQRSKLQQMQMEAYQAQAERVKAQTAQELAAQAEAQRVNGLLRNAGRVPAGMGAGLSPDVLGGLPPEMQTGTAVPALRSGGAIDFQSLYQQGVPFERLKSLAETSNLGKQEVKDWQDIEGAGGAKIRQGFDRFGQPVGTGVNGYVAPVQVNQGDKVSFVKPSAGVTLPVGMSPSERDSSARGWAGVRQAGKRIAMDRDKLTNPRATGPMSVTLQKELIESDDTAQTSKSVISSLQRAKAINEAAYSGWGASTRAKIVSNVGSSDGADATVELDNILTGQGLEQMKAIFGAAPTEGERKILMDMQASSDKTPKQREAILDRAIAAAERRATYAQSRAGAIRGGTYLTDGVPQVASPAAQTPPAGKTVVKTGMYQGRKVVQYDDGTTSYAD